MLDWRELVRLSDDELARFDIAAVNLACAAGLPGAEVIDVDHCLRTIDAWADRVRQWTDLSYQQYFLPDPGAYDNSEAVFRAANLVLCLQRRCGVRYDPAKKDAKPDDPFDFHEEFIHGVIQGPGGVCGTIPVVLAAVGRRLGYPIRVVKTVRHLFARWDDQVTGEKVNIQWCDTGAETPPDDKYREWPDKLPPEAEQVCGYLKSLTPRRELAYCIGRRGYRWRDVGDYRRSIAAFVTAADLDVPYVNYPTCVRECADEWETKLRARIPPGFPRVEAGFNPQVRRWSGMPAALEHRIRVLEAVEDALDDAEHVRWWWAPLRDGRPPLRPVPRVMSTNRSKEDPCSIRA